MKNLFKSYREAPKELRRFIQTIFLIGAILVVTTAVAYCRSKPATSKQQESPARR